MLPATNVETFFCSTGMSAMNEGPVTEATAGDEVETGISLRSEDWVLGMREDRGEGVHEGLENKDR